VLSPGYTGLPGKRSARACTPAAQPNDRCISRPEGSEWAIV
jgi:hypothetical protein